MQLVELAYKFSRLSYFSCSYSFYLFISLLSTSLFSFLLSPLLFRLRKGRDPALRTSAARQCVISTPIYINAGPAICYKTTYGCLIDSFITFYFLMTTHSLSSLESDDISHPNYHEAIPIELSNVADEAVSRQISRIQSRRSSASKISEVSEEHSEPPYASQSAQKSDDLENAAGVDAAKTKTRESISNNANFTRFSESKKNLCVVIAASSGFLSPLSGLAFLPAVPEIAARFNTTGEVINISSAVYCVFMSLSPCIFSPISDIYGRRITFLVCAFLFSVCTILVAVSVNLTMFYIFRSLTALFGTSFFSIGGHIVGDLYPPVRRGTYMAWIISGAQLGTAFGSVGGGIIVNYTSWRIIFWVLAGIGFGVFVPAFIFLPETLAQTRHQLVLEEIHKDNPGKKFVWIPINPFSVMGALKYPNLAIDGYITITILFTMYSLLTPIRYVVDPRFHLEKPIYSGLFYLAPGMGFLVGSFFGGKWADSVVKKWIAKRGKRVPEDRIRRVIIPLGIVYPVSILIYGWSIEKAKGGMAVPIIFMFLCGAAQVCIFPAINVYCVDSMPQIGGLAIASSYFTRYLAAAVASATCLRSVERIGVGWTCTISAFVLWSGLGCALVLIYYGESMREKAVKKQERKKSKTNSS